MLRLWKYNKVTGYWDYKRTVTSDTSAAWLAIWRRHEPDQSFVVSSKKPIKSPTK